MTTRMEAAAERTAMTALRRLAAAADTPLTADVPESRFRANWPQAGSATPMKDAMTATLTAAVLGKSNIASEPHQWQKAVERAWEQAVDDTVEEYFALARAHFKRDEPLLGTQVLTDAIRAKLGHIAALRGWAHATDQHLDAAADALAPPEEFPWESQEYRKPDERTEKQRDFQASFAVAMDRPLMVQYPDHYDRTKGADEDAEMFARNTIRLAGELAGAEAVKT